LSFIVDFNVYFKVDIKNKIEFKLKNMFNNFIIFRFKFYFQVIISNECNVLGHGN